jgi:hypothetical protein
MVDLAFAAPNPCHLYPLAQVTTVLNPATRPSRRWAQVMRGRYEKAGLSIKRATIYDHAFRRREEAALGSSIASIPAASS